MAGNSYQAYWKMVRFIARKKASQKLGIWGRFLTFLVSSAALAVVAFVLGGNLLNTIAVALVTALFWIIVWTGVVTYYKAHQPAIIYEEQQSQLQELQSKSETLLDIVTVRDFSEDIIDEDGKTKKYLTLGVYNASRVFKLMEFGADAILTASHQIADGEVITNAWGPEALQWIEERKELIEIRPTNTARLIVAVLEGDVLYTRGSKHEGKNEIVLQLILSFSGKYEGETRFRNHLEYRGIYCSPADKRLQFTNIAVHNPRGIDPRLFEAMGIMNRGELYINNS